MRRGVAVEELELGQGAEATRETTVHVRYDLYLNFGECLQRGVQHSIDLGAREVIAGLRYGIEGMCVGGRRRIRVGPHLAYRDRGVPGVIPPNALLIFDVELLGVTTNRAAA